MYRLNLPYQQSLPFGLVVLHELQQRIHQALLRLLMCLFQLENLLLPLHYASIMFNCWSFNIRLILFNACCPVALSSIRLSKLNETESTSSTTTSPLRSIIFLFGIMLVVLLHYQQFDS